MAVAVDWPYTPRTGHKHTLGDMMGWTVTHADTVAVDLVHGDYRATLYAPAADMMDGWADIDFGARKLRPIYSAPLGKLPEDLKGPFRRSVHRAALQSLVSEWSPTALALLVHHTQGRCSTWCTMYACPLAGLDTAAQAGHTA